VQPVNGSGDGDHHGEHVGGNTCRFVDKVGIEINIGIKLRLDKVFITMYLYISALLSISNDCSVL
jgi:hypothetical protein